MDFYFRENGDEILLLCSMFTDGTYLFELEAQMALEQMGCNDINVEEKYIEESPIDGKPWLQSRVVATGKLSRERFEELIAEGVIDYEKKQTGEVK